MCESGDANCSVTTKLHIVVYNGEKILLCQKDLNVMRCNAKDTKELKRMKCVHASEEDDDDDDGGGALLLFLLSLLCNNGMCNTNSMGLNECLKRMNPNIISL